MKRLLILGGSRYIIPVIEAAHNLGCYVITCDYLPNNIAHKYSDEYVNVSVIDHEKVLEISKRKKIDGIMSFACDPGVTTAAYVAEKMGLPSVADYNTVCIMQNKDLFRKFLKENGFNVPWSISFGNYKEVLENINRIHYPAIVKPVDSAGSRGVSRVECQEQLKESFDKAIDASFKKKVIIEEYLEKEGDPSDCDCFSINGDLVSVNFSSQKFDSQASNQYVPMGFAFPSSMNQEFIIEISKELQRLCTLLKLGTSIYNVETRISKNGKSYIMEVSPRGGGNRLAEMVKHTTGVDLIMASVKAALGMKIDLSKEEKNHGYWYEYIVHSNTDGHFDHIEIEESLKKHLVEEELWLNSNKNVKSFSSARDTLGTLIFKFHSEESFKEGIERINEKIKVIVK